MALSTEEEIELIELELELRNRGEIAEPPSPQVEQQPFEETGGLQDIPFTTQNLEAKQARQEQFEGLPESQQAQFAEALGEGVQAGFEELGQPDVRTREQMAKTQARQRAFKEKEERRARGELTTSERILDVAFTEDITRDPAFVDGGPVEALRAVGGASSIFARGLGAIAQKGDIAKESTKLFKGSIEDLNEWANSRRAQNTTADEMIANLREAIDREGLDEAVKADILAQIEKIEESKNSGVITTAVDVLGNLFLETGSDPGVILGVGKEAIKRVAKKPLKEAVEKGVQKTAGRLKKLGIRNNKMLEFLDAQPGSNVREKLSNLRKRQAGELTPTGQIQEESIETMFDERTLESLEDNVDAVQAEMDALKGVETDVRASVAAKKEARKEAVTGEEKAGLLQEEIAGAERKAGIEVEAKARVEAVPSDIEPKEVVGEFTREGRFSGRSTNQAFEEAETLAKAGKVDVATRKKLIGEMIASAEGDIDRVVDYTDVVNVINRINKNAPLAEYRKALIYQDIDPAFAESFRRLKQGTANDVVASKRQFNKALAKEGVALDDTIKRAADNFKIEADKVVESSLGTEGYEKLLKAQKEGGRISNARKKLLKIMKVDHRKTEVIDDIDFNDAIANLDAFIDESANKLAKQGDLTDMAEGGRFPEWKKHFGIDVEKEVRNRAKKLGIAGEAKEAVKAVDVDTKRAQKAITEASTGVKKKIDAYAKQSIAQVKKGIRRRSMEIKKTLDKAKTESALKRNVAEDFRKEVKHFANKGGFSKNTESFKSFERKYGEKIADMVEDQAIFATFDVSPTGKIKNADALLEGFRGVTAPTQGLQVAKFAEGAINKLSKKIKPFEGRVNKAINKVKSVNRELAKEINKAKKAGKNVDEQIKFMMNKQPLVTADILASEFKFFEPLDFFDKKMLNGVIRSTTGEYTNRQKMAAKRLLKKVERTEASK